ncbi:MAG: hypothetical protein FWD53_05795 [Phycisphaerales bacterium]|nr:hypothetical protein [Phycisphaerales bacterium]
MEQQIRPVCEYAAGLCIKLADDAVLVVDGSAIRDGESSVTDVSDVEVSGISPGGAFSIDDDKSCGSRFAADIAVVVIITWSESFTVDSTTVGDFHRAVAQHANNKLKKNRDHVRLGGGAHNKELTTWQRQ